MREKIAEFFHKNGIEYFSAVSYSDCKETSPKIRERAGFVPRSVIIYLIPYYAGTAENISVYAASRDYHLFVREFSSLLSDFMKSIYPSNSFLGYADHSPIDERHAALIAGLGIAGDNGLIINETYGSYVFIGEMLTDIEPSLLFAKSQKIATCSHCGRCRTACPTGILASGNSDCLSAITQRKGELSDTEAELMKRINTAWGCDICQKVCPHNSNPVITPIGFFHRDRIECLTTAKLSSLSPQALRERAFGWRGRAVIQRNLEILEK